MGRHAGRCQKTTVTKGSPTLKPTISYLLTREKSKKASLAVRLFFSLALSESVRFLALGGMEPQKLVVPAEYHVTVHLASLHRIEEPWRKPGTLLFGTPRCCTYPYSPKSCFLTAGKCS